MLRYVLLLLTVTYSSAQYQKRCCIPDQFEGVIGDYNGFTSDGKPGLSKGFIVVSFDYSTKRVADFINMTTNGVPYIQKLILDYNTNVMYTIDPRRRTCKATSPPPPLQRCVPEDARELGSYYLGAGNNKLRARSFMFQDESKQISAVASFTEDCIPLGEVAFGSQKEVNFMMTWGWVDITLGIKDPSVFAVPKYCQGVQVVESESKFSMGNIFRSKKPGFN